MYKCSVAFIVGVKTPASRSALFRLDEEKELPENGSIAKPQRMLQAEAVKSGETYYSRSSYFHWHIL